ncbi:C40 family peptidase [Vibrio profundi]|uniref:C40 family peptidase n=1 Tax=Vibrio profundi TaxID=1774960 RepID=UPI0037360631
MKAPIILYLTFNILLLTACSHQPDFSAPESAYRNQPTSHAEKETTQAYLALYDKWQGVPYLYGGNSFSGIDCSAFVQVVVRDVTQQLLPRTTHQQSEHGLEVSFEQAKSGDLVFFRTSRSTNHVGVYLGNKQFLHASTSKGVIISRLDNPYWASVFWQFRRV